MQHKVLAINWLCFAVCGKLGATLSHDESKEGSEKASGNGQNVCNLASTYGQRLCTFQEAPAVLQFNRFIRTGYRAGLTYPQCACSIFQCHNETGGLNNNLGVKLVSHFVAGCFACICVTGGFLVDAGNILTHLVPAVVMVAMILRQMVAPWQHAKLEYWQNLGSILLCFCLSVAYHTCMANHKHYSTWLKLDVSCHILLIHFAWHIQMHRLNL